MHRAAVLAALALAACTAGEPGPAPSPTPSPTPTEPPDDRLLLAAYLRNETLIGLYGVSLGNRPLAPTLRAHLAEHRAALLARVTATPTPVPARPAAVAIPALAAAVRRTSRDDVAAAGRAADPANALLLAEVGASRAQHAVLLGRLR